MNSKPFGHCCKPFGHCWKRNDAAKIALYYVHETNLLSPWTEPNWNTDIIGRRSFKIDYTRRRNERTISQKNLKFHDHTRILNVAFDRFFNDIFLNDRFIPKLHEHFVISLFCTTWIDSDCNFIHKDSLQFHSQIFVRSKSEIPIQEDSLGIPCREN